MKNLKSLFVTLLFVLFGISTASAANIELFSKDYKVKSFSSVHANTIADIVYTQSDKVIVKAEGSQELIDNLRVSVHDGILTIENDRELNKKSDEPLIIIVSSPTISLIETNGLGDVYLKGKIKTDNLDINAEGFGNVIASELESKRICVNYNGIGDLKLAGKTDIVQINSGGIGNVDCQNLLAKTAMVKSTKIGKVNCFASESLGLFNDGIGEITYHGNPTFKNLQNAGMGIINEGK